MCFSYFVFFFKPKSAYEMRISDWRSDVCSSDLSALAAAKASALASRYDRDTVALTVTSGVAATYLQVLESRERLAIARENLASAEEVFDLRSEGRRGGKGGVSTGRSWWQADT